MLKFKDYNKSTKNGTEKYACKNCGRKKISENFDTSKYYNLFVDMCNKNNFTPISKLEDYKNAYTKLKYICPYHGEKEITYASISSGAICSECAHKNAGNKNSKPINEVIQIIQNKNNNKLLNPNDYINVKTKNLKIQCGTCGEVFITSLDSIQNSSMGCRKCGIKKNSSLNRLSLEKVSSIINSVNQNVLLNPSEYINNNTVNLKIRCGSCGGIFVTSLANYTYFQTNRCKKCSHRVSKGEIAVANVLDRYHITYTQEKIFDDCRDKKPLPFDFFIEKYNACIEFDGQLHYMNIFGDEALKKTQKHDEIKTQYCKEHNIKLIRIPYWEGNNIESIIIKEFHLNKHIKYKHNKIT